MERLGRLLGSQERLRSLLGRLKSVLEASWGVLSGSWEGLGSILEPTWEIFGAQKGLGKHLGSDDVKL